MYKRRHWMLHFETLSKHSGYSLGHNYREFHDMTMTAVSTCSQQQPTGSTKMIITSPVCFPGKT